MWVSPWTPYSRYWTKTHSRTPNLGESINSPVWIWYAQKPQLNPVRNTVHYWNTLIHAHRHTHTHPYTSIHNHTHSYTLIHTHTNSYTLINTHIYTHTHIHTRIYTHAYTHTHHTHIHTHILITHTHILTHIHTHIINTHTCARVYAWARMCTACIECYMHFGKGVLGTSAWEGVYVT